MEENNINMNKYLLIGLFVFIVASIGIFVYTNTVTKNNTNNNNYYDSTEVDVESYGKEPAYSDNKKIEVENSIYYINVGETVKINVTSEEEAITFTSLDPNVLSVDELGNVLGLLEGRTKVLASNQNNEQVSVDVIVVDPNKNVKEEVKKQDAINNSKAVENTKTPVPSNTPVATPTEEPYSPTPSNDGSGDTPTPTPSVSPKPWIPDIPVGTPEGKISGPVEIIRTPDAEITLPVISVAIETDMLTGHMGNTVTLHAAIYPSNATAKTIRWTSSDPSVVSVVENDNNGVLTFKKAGTATITASAGGKSDKCVVTVK